MAIQHKFYQKNWMNGFETHNGILDVTLYEPEIMFIGTFNPDTANTNFADFFYGRNYFWPAFKNLFIYNEVIELNRRIPSNGTPPAILNPTLSEIFELCSSLKLTFSDLVLETLHNNNPQYQLLGNDNVIFNGQEFNLIQDGLNRNIGGLQQLNALGQVHWNTQNIINYLCDNPQIEQIYFTRQPTGIWKDHWRAILHHQCMMGRNLTNIFTPSGQGRPVFHSMNRLLHHWVHNLVQRFGQLNNDWLHANGVILTNF